MHTNKTDFHIRVYSRSFVANHSPRPPETARLASGSTKPFAAATGTRLPAAAYALYPVLLIGTKASLKTFEPQMNTNAHE